MKLFFAEYRNSDFSFSPLVDLYPPIFTGQKVDSMVHVC